MSMGVLTLVIDGDMLLKSTVPGTENGKNLYHPMRDKNLKFFRIYGVFRYPVWDIFKNVNPNRDFF